MNPTLDCTQFENTKWCWNGECEYRHLSDSEKALRQNKGTELSKKCHSFLNQLNDPKLIIAAGPERSGSTWLYNAIRLLFLHSNLCINSYWIHSITTAKILKRSQSLTKSIKNAEEEQKQLQVNDEETKQDDYNNKNLIEHLLIKTHEYPFTQKSDKNLFLNLKPIIIITHRDLRNVVLSYRRVGWCSFLPMDYIPDHLKWKEISSLDLGFEDIMKDQLNALRTIAEHIGILKTDIKDNKLCDLWLNNVLMDLNNLKAPTNRYGPDNISKLWPSHIADKTTNEKQLDNKTEQKIFQKYGAYMKLYNYN